MAGKAYIVLGTGPMGIAAAFELALNGVTSRVTLVDTSLAVARGGAQRIKKILTERGARPPRFTTLALDARRESDLYKTIRGHDGVLSALPHRLNVAVARAAIAAKAHYVDLGGHFETTQEILRLDRPAQKMGVALTPDCGLAPGLCNSVAAQGISQMDRVEEVKILCGGLPEHEAPPLGYKKVFNLDGLLKSYFGTATQLRNGQVTQVPSFSEKEEIVFPPPIGTLEAFVTAGATSTAPWTYEGQVRRYSYKTLRYPGHFDKVLALKQLGMLDEKPLAVDGQNVVPQNVFLALAQGRLAYPEIRDMVVLQVTVRGTQGGQRVEIVYDLLEYEDAMTGFTAMQRATGFTAAVALEMLVAGTVRAVGVAPLERAFPPAPFLDAVQRRGLRIRDSGPRPILPN
jgi:lysine 6-dehydrogenase